MTTTFLLAHGATNTLIHNPGVDYDGITFAEIIARVKEPTAVDKTEADFIIPSTYRRHDGRSHDTQRRLGSYRLLCLDVDTGNPSREDVVEAVHNTIGRCSLLAYSSASSTVDHRKWRVLIPLKQPISGAEYEDAQSALFDLLIARNITCDGALARCGQPVFLPNIPPDRRKPSGKPEFYENFICRDQTFDYEGSRLEAEVHSRREQERLIAEAAAAARLERERERAARRIDRPHEVDPIAEFISRHAIGDLLVRYGYEQRGSSSHYRSPHQTSGSFATRDYGTHWVSLSSTDAALGVGKAKAEGKVGYCWGDAFDLFVHYDHHGDFKAAMRAYAAELRAQALLPAPEQPVDSLDDFDLVPTAVDPDASPEPPQSEPDDIPAADPPDDGWPHVFDRFDASVIPKRQWVYGYDYVKNYVSVLASAPGIGKSSLVTVEAISIATGRELLGVKVKQRSNVWLVNLEDPVDEMHMRTLAAMKHYGIKPDDLRGRLFIDGEDTFQMTLAAESRDGILTNDALLDLMIAKVRERDIGVIIFDPFVSTHSVNENSNSSVQQVVAMMRKLARDTAASILLVHHVRKGNGDDASIDSVRGAGSLIGAARAARVINKVSEDDALKLGIDPGEARGIFRVDDGKSNLAPPAHAAVYRRMVSVEIDNGEWIGVCTPFDLPDEWSGMTDKVVNDILRIIEFGIKTDDGSEEYYSIRPQDKDRFAGKVITSYAFDNPADAKNDAQAKRIIKMWHERGLLEEFDYRSEKQRKDRRGVRPTGRVGEQF